MSSSSNDVELRRMGRGQQLRDEDEIDMEAGHERAVNSDLLRPPRSAVDAATKRRVMISACVGILAVVILGGLVIAMIAATPSSSPSDLNLSWRLPNTTIPSNYDLYLSLDFNNFTFIGNVDITLKLNASTNTIVMNAADMTFQGASIHLVEGDNAKEIIEAFNISQNTEREFVFFKFRNNLVADKDYVLHINFTGNINNELRGLYRSSFVDAQGEVHWMATTQFEPSDARRAFPCFDEPDYKATYDITIEAPSALTILSNAGVASTESGGKKRKIITFKTTPPMSSYLVAFIVGEFEAAKPVNKSDTVISVWTVPGKSQYAQFAADFTRDALDEMEKYFGFEYPISKLDLVAIPDFSAGAMNWGLITFRETALLIGSNAARRDYSAVGGTVAHELVHQWTGDLVTCVWWSTLWLNEGFATFYEPYFVDNLHPEWRELDAYLGIQTAGMDEDGLPSTHAIVLPVNSPDEGQDVFDGVTYEKGGSVLRMISTYLDETKGPNTWRNALRAYIKKYSYSNADTPDLWNTIGEGVGIPGLTDLMLNWTNTPGYPVVTFQKTSGDNKYVAQQNRYYSLRDESTPKDDGQTWWIPLNVILSTGESVELTALTTPASQSFTLKTGGGGWFKANKEQTGFYRVNYPLDNWHALHDNFQDLSEYDRAGLVNDAAHFTFSGELPPVEGFKFLQALKDERENVVWSTVWGTLSTFFDLMNDLECYPAFQAYIRYIMQPAVEQIGWHDQFNSTHSQGLLRYSLLNAAVKFDAFPSSAEPLEKFKCAVGQHNCTPDVSSDARLAAYRAGVQYGGLEDYQAVFDLYLVEKDSNEKVRLLNALTFATQRGLIQNTLKISLDTSIVRSQDRERLVVGVGQNPLGREMAWAFIKENWSTFNQRGFGVQRLMDVLTHFEGEFWYKEFSDFFTQNPPLGAARALQGALEIVRANGKWIDTYSDDVCSWLNSQNFAQN